MAEGGERVYGNTVNFHALFAACAKYDEVVCIPYHPEFSLLHFSIVGTLTFSAGARHGNGAATDGLSHTLHALHIQRKEPQSIAEAYGQTTFPFAFITISCSKEKLALRHLINRGFPIRSHGCA